MSFEVRVAVTGKARPRRRVGFVVLVMRERQNSSCMQFTSKQLHGTFLKTELLVKWGNTGWECYWIGRIGLPVNV